MVVSNNQHYNSYEKRLDTVLGPKAVDWARIRRARAEFDEEFFHVPDIDTSDFAVWLAHTYGIQLKLDATFAVESVFEIVDDQKYTVFLLKYS
jgi:hypothetical protein